MSYLKNRTLCAVRTVATKVRFWNVSDEFELKLSVPQMKRILRKHDLAYDENGNPSWWYSALLYKRNTRDDLTKGALKHIHSHVPKDARILITGCGIGGMMFWLAQHGFRNLCGFDYLPNVVAAANEIARQNGIHVTIWQDDGFGPKTQLGTYDAILALYWLCSAWAGNYGNASRAKEDRDALLQSFLSIYAPHVAVNGYIMLELIDAIADYREPPLDVYPIRHSREQVEKCAHDVGLAIEKMMFSCSHGYLPRMLYVLKRRPAQQQ